MDADVNANVDALIIGAGPAGSAAAILLARAGWSVALVEMHEFPRRKVCGECIAASNLPLLDALGVGAAVRAAAGAELRTVVLLHGAWQSAAPLPAAASPGSQWGRALGRETLDRLMLEQARSSGAAIWQPWRVEHIAGGPGQWQCRLRAGDRAVTSAVRAGVLIAAHGSCAAPHAGEAARPHRAGDLFAFKANFLGATLAAGLLPVLCLDGGYGGMVVADGASTTLACCLRRDRLAALRAASPGRRASEVVETWLRTQCDGVQRALADAVRVGPWLASGPLAPGVRVDAGDGMLRIGNAAGEVHPILGEGISMALQSAAMLALELLHVPEGRHFQGAAARDWQQQCAQAYARQWRRQFRLRLRVAATFAHAAMHPGTARAMLALARLWPRLLTQGAVWGGKTRCAVEPAAPGI